MEVGVRIVLAAVLAAAAFMKLRDPATAGDGLATFGLPRRLWPALVALELTLAIAVAAGVDEAAFAAAGLLGAFAVALAAAQRDGRAGRPCACFGPRSRVGWPAAGRSAVLAAGFAAVPFLPAHASGEAWLALGLGVALAAIAGLAVAVLALAREIGVLRLRLPPQSALEVADEGPRLAVRTPLIERFGHPHPPQLALAVFTSPGCHLCRSVEPAVAAFASDPLVALQVFDEERDREVWEELEIPGSPYAVALDATGIVRAKGTFNSYGQLESILAAAERRTREAAAA